MNEENAGLGGALGEAVSHLRNEPLLSFGIAVVIVIGVIATAGAGSWVPVVVALVVALAVLVAWLVNARRGAAPGVDLETSGVKRVGRRVKVQRYEGPDGPSLRVKSRFTGTGATEIEEGAEIQGVKITSEPPEPRDPG